MSETYYVDPKTAAYILDISIGRIRQLLADKRIFGAFKVDGFWRIPLHDGKIKVKRAPWRHRKGSWDATYRVHKQGVMIHVWKDRLVANNKKTVLMTEPIPPITLPTAENPQLEGEWLQNSLHRWLDAEFIPEQVNAQIARRTAQIYVRHRMEGENDLGALVIALVTELQAFDFSLSFYGQFAIANAVSDLLLQSLGIDRCCGQ